ASRFVAGFIGSPAMNIVRGRIDEAGGALPDGGRLALPDPALRRWVGREIEVGMRPEHLRPGPTDGAAIVATVELVEMLGADTLVHARRGDTQFVARLHEGEAPALDEQVGLTPVPGTLHFFDPATGLRLEPGRGDPYAATPPAAPPAGPRQSRPATSRAAPSGPRAARRRGHGRACPGRRGSPPRSGSGRSGRAGHGCRRSDAPGCARREAARPPPRACPRRSRGSPGSSRSRRRA